MILPLAQPNQTRATLVKWTPTVHRCTLETCRREIKAKKGGKRQAIVCTIYYVPGTFQVRTEHFHPKCYDGRWGPLMQANWGFERARQKRSWA